MNKQQLASKIWESANKMRSKIEANEYKDYILGFIFYKFLSDREEKYLRNEGWDDEYMSIYLREKYDNDLFDKSYTIEDHEQMIANIRNNIGYFIGYDYLFTTWIKKGSDFNVADVRDGLSAFSRLISKSHKKVFEGVFDTLQTGLSKLGDTSNSQTKAISDLINLIKDIPMDGKQDYDVLGFIYEYLISNFAANAGKKAGEFYTPHEVSVLMSEIVADHLKDRNEIKIYDPTSGSGSLLINIGSAVAKYMGSADRIKYYAQELKENTYNLTRMNLVMRGILPDNIVARNGDTLEEDWPYFDDSNPIETYEPLFVDAVVSNPPYSQQWNPVDKETDERYAKFGVAPKGKADYAFLLHDLFHLKPDGIMNIVLPHGVLFRGGEEGEIRRNLIEYNHIDAVIGLPANIFFGTGIPTIIMVLKKQRTNTDVLIIDASKGYEKVGKNNKLRASDIKRIVDAVVERKTVDSFSRVVSRDEIRANDYNLNIPRYVDSSEKVESWDIYASMFGGIPRKEVEEIDEYFAAFPGLKDELFKQDNSEYYRLKVDNIKLAVKNYSSVKNYENDFVSSFEGFDQYLEKELMSDGYKVNVSKEEQKLSDHIFDCLNGIPLVDKYDAYQILDNNWNGIAVDLEIIQTEGEAAIKQVDPNMVIKKKDGKEKEVQDGWIGHIIPFELVQKTILKEQLDSLVEDENRLSEIVSEYEEHLEELSEEDKDKSFVNDDRTAFVWKEVNKVCKNRSEEDDTLKVLDIVANLNKEEKAVKKRIKEKTISLIDETKDVIENLSDDDIQMLLKLKWIDPLVNGINKLTEDLIDGFVSKLEKLSTKYDDTLSEIDAEIKENENSLSEMINELTGSDYDMKGLEEISRLLGGM